MSTETNPQESKFIPEEIWTAQMVGKHFLRNDEIIDIDYRINPMPRVEFEDSDTY